MSDHNRQHPQQNRQNRNNPQTQSKQNANNNNGAQAIIPAGNNVQNIFTNNGNFCLWFNKYTPIVIGSKDEYHTCNKSGVSSEAVNFYKEQYDNCAKGIDEKLKMLHMNQRDYLLSFPEQDYEVIELKATTKTPLITGIGQPHANEVSMVFDYMLGIPYIPASSIKGLLRFTTVVIEVSDPKNENKYIPDKNGNINDENIAEIKYYFGGQSNEGSVVFLDAYPEGVPELHIDIMNPHYGAYYQECKPPADYLEPTPIKFLTVAPKTTFIFRVIIHKQKPNYESLKQSVKTILEEALTKEGIGAKTALGYGLFEPIKEANYTNLLEKRKEREEGKKKMEEERKIANMSEVDKKVYELSKLTNSDSDFNGRSVPIYNEIDSYQEDEKKKIAEALMKYWQKIGKWDSKAEKQVEKVKKLKSILGLK